MVRRTVNYTLSLDSNVVDEVDKKLITEPEFSSRSHLLRVLLKHWLDSINREESAVIFDINEAIRVVEHLRKMFPDTYNVVHTNLVNALAIVEKSIEATKKEMKKNDRTEETDRPRNR